MIDRRQLLLAAGTSLTAGWAEAAWAQGRLSDPEQAVWLYRLLDAFMDSNLARSPETATRLGLDRGAAKSRLDDRSPAARERDRRENRERQAALARIDRQALGGRYALAYDTVAYGQDLKAETDRRFAYAGPAEDGPYAVSQLDGAYLSVPDFLDTQHAIKAKADADAYLARVEALATAMDQEAETVRRDADAGCVPPAFVIDSALKQMRAFAETSADQSTLVTSVAERAAAAGIAGDYAGPAAALYDGKVIPALNRQMALLQSLRPQANPGAGVATLPDGEAYYALALKSWITTDLSPTDAHRLGLEQVAKLTADLDGEFRKHGMTRGAVWERLRALFGQARFLYPNTDAGKAQLIADLNLKVKAVQARLPAWFGTLPKAGVEIRRVPPAIEAGASSNYQSGSLDGSRPGAYYIVLRDTAEDPSWVMPTLTFHESIPGHHLQGTLAQEANLPLLLKSTWFSAYGEGWALYAEQLADEMGMYENDPFGRIGYLHDALLRAARMVMDSGLHAMGWSRAQAVRYFVENQGDPESSAVAEVERYCCWPGQACSYMVGKLEWLRLRARARAALGPRFDIRRFHDAGLLGGALPLRVLADAIEGHIEQAKA